MAQLLIDASADLNGQGFLGAQLHVAAFSGHRAGSGLLIAWGRTAGMTRLSCTGKRQERPRRAEVASSLACFSCV